MKGLMVSIRWCLEYLKGIVAGAVVEPEPDSGRPEQLRTRCCCTPAAPRAQDDPEPECSLNSEGRWEALCSGDQ